MKNIFLAIIAIFAFSSCEKVIELDLGNTESNLIIEGNVTNQAEPYFVKLTKTVNFSDANNYPSVSNATVVIADDAGQKETLTYTANGIYKTNTLKGISGRTYFLTVAADGKTYTAQSTMPQNVVLDSLRHDVLQFGGRVRNTVTPIFRDPSVIGNNYRFVVKIDGVLDKTNVVANDNVSNGIVNQRPIFTNDIEIKTGNNVQVEMQCIDANAFAYYFTLQQMAGNGPGGGTTPSNPPNGISGGALGLFSAYTTQIKSKIIP